MTIFLHELRRNRISLAVWTGVISFMLGVTAMIYPEMKSQMGEMTDMFANMGDFTAAFGMDELNFGEFMGYFGIECGNVLGLGGGFFAALMGISALAKEEKDGTAEFLLTHPITRRRIITEKLLSLVAEITVLNLTVAAVSSLCILAIGEEVDAGKIALVFLAYYIMQLEVGAITFAISAFIRGGGLGIGLGTAFGFYFINIASNLMNELEFLKYITPYGYTDVGYIVNNGSLDFKYIAVGLLFISASVFFAYFKYEKKDIT